MQRINEKIVLILTDVFLITLSYLGLFVLRFEFKEALESENIEARPVWKPLHLQPVFKDCPYYGSGLSEEIFDKGLCLPSGSNLSKEDLGRVVKVVRKVRP